MELPLACTLTPEAAERQEERFRVLSRSATGATRDGDAIRVAFDAGLDRATLDEAIAVERDCCPFFTLSYDEPARTLTVLVDDPAHRAALDTVAQRLGAA